MTDEQALERVETLIATQQPASQPWQPVTDYSFAAREPIERPHAALILKTFPLAKRIADVGCGPGHLVRLLQELGAGRVTVRGYDREPHGKDQRHLDIGCPEALPGNFGDSYNGPFYDLVIYREVNEHLTLGEIGCAVGNLCTLSSRWIYGTTRFHPGPAHVFDVATSDELDPTHITLLTKPLLRFLFLMHGFRYRADLAEQMDHRGYGRTFVFEQIRNA